MNFLEFLLLALAFQRRDDRLGGGDERVGILFGNLLAALGHDFHDKRVQLVDGDARLAILKFGQGVFQLLEQAGFDPKWKAEVDHGIDQIFQQQGTLALAAAREEDVLNFRI